MTNNNFWEWLFIEIEVKDISHLDKKFDQQYMTTPVFTNWFAETLKKNNEISEIK